MKTVPQVISFETFISQYDSKTQEVLLKLDAICKKETKSVAKIFGRDIIGYGDMTYSNTKLKDQPWFKIGLRVSKTGMTLYLSAYQEELYKLADSIGLKYGKGCFYMKKKDFSKLENVELLIHQSLKS